MCTDPRTPLVGNYSRETLTYLWKDTCKDFHYVIVCIRKKLKNHGWSKQQLKRKGESLFGNASKASKILILIVVVITLTSRKYAYYDIIYVKMKKGKLTKIHISHGIYVYVHACICTEEKVCKNRCKSGNYTDHRERIWYSIYICLVVLIFYNRNVYMYLSLM